MWLLLSPLNNYTASKTYYWTLAFQFLSLFQCVFAISITSVREEEAEAKAYLGHLAKEVELFV